MIKIKRFMAAAGGIMFIGMSTAVFGQAVDKVIYQQDFETWEFVEMPPQMAKAIRKQKDENADINLDMRGPLYRKFTDLWTGCVPGRMIEGSVAYKGKSICFNNDGKAVIEVGLHGPFCSMLKPGKTYKYVISLRGKGHFLLKAWVGGNEKAGGAFKWLGFPDLVDIPLTEDWKVYSDTFTLPQYDGALYRMNDKNSFAFVFVPGTSAYIDDFKLSEMTEVKQP